MTDDEAQQAYWEDEHGHRGYDHPVVAAFARQRVAEVFCRWLDLGEVRTALDVACGDGFSTWYVGEHVAEVHGIDRSGRMLRRHPMFGTDRLVQGDVRELPFDDGRFDLVYAWEALHHVSNPQDVLAEMARVSRRYVLVAEPNRRNPAQLAFALADREHRWVLRYSLAYMRRVFARAGLHVLKAAAGGWIFPNKTPRWLLPALRRLPYWCPLGITNWVLGIRREAEP